MVTRARFERVSLNNLAVFHWEASDSASALAHWERAVEVEERQMAFLASLHVRGHVCWKRRRYADAGTLDRLAR